jgi:two-component system LytT family response regulator
MDMKLRVAIIDDEIHAIETLRYDLREGFSENSEIIFSTTDPIEGARLARELKPELLFLDINMPGISGIEFMKLNEDLDIMIALTTAHQEFAIQAVGSRAIGYILKPVQMSDLQRIISQAEKARTSKKQGPLLMDRIAIHNHDSIELVAFQDILYCKSDGNYCELILLGNRRLLASRTLKTIASSLPSHQFSRIHKSYLVNIQQIKKYLKRGHGEIVMANDDVLPVSRNNQQEVLRIIQTYL